MSPTRVCVFAGAQTGEHPDYSADAARFGCLLAENGIGLVYGGGSVGLMGVAAAAVRDAGGEVTGVIPRALLELEVGDEPIGDLRVVETMFERKAMMMELSDAFVALPGGLGTLDEMFEVLTWTLLSFHDKPAVFLNTRGYYDRLDALLGHLVDEGFLKADHRTLAPLAESPEHALKILLDS